MASYLTLKLPDQICNSPYYQLYNSYNVSSGNLVLDQQGKFCIGHSWELKAQFTFYINTS